MDQFEARSEFMKRFRQLHASAGSPSLTRVAQAASRLFKHDERGTPVRVSNQRISDWRRGTNVPAKFSALAVVFEVLTTLARTSVTDAGLRGAVRPGPVA